MEGSDTQKLERRVDKPRENWQKEFEGRSNALIKFLKGLSPNLHSNIKRIN